MHVLRHRYKYFSFLVLFALPITQGNIYASAMAGGVNPAFKFSTDLMVSELQSDVEIMLEDMNTNKNTLAQVTGSVLSIMPGVQKDVNSHSFSKALGKVLREVLSNSTDLELPVKDLTSKVLKEVGGDRLEDSEKNELNKKIGRFFHTAKKIKVDVSHKFQIHLQKAVWELAESLKSEASSLNYLDFETDFSPILSKKIENFEKNFWSMVKSKKLSSNELQSQLENLELFNEYGDSIKKELLESLYKPAAIRLFESEIGAFLTKLGSELLFEFNSTEWSELNTNLILNYSGPELDLLKSILKLIESDKTQNLPLFSSEIEIEIFLMENMPSTTGWKDMLIAIDQMLDLSDTLASEVNKIHSTYILDFENEPNSGLDLSDWDLPPEESDEFDFKTDLLEQTITNLWDILQTTEQEMPQIQLATFLHSNDLCQNISKANTMATLILSTTTSFDSLKEEVLHYHVFNLGQEKVSDAINKTLETLIIELNNTKVKIEEYYAQNFIQTQTQIQNPSNPHNESEAIFTKEVKEFEQGETDEELAAILGSLTEVKQKEKSELYQKELNENTKLSSLISIKMSEIMSITKIFGNYSISAKKFRDSFKKSFEELLYLSESINGRLLEAFVGEFEKYAQINFDINQGTFERTISDFFQKNRLFIYQTEGQDSIYYYIQLLDTFLIYFKTMDIFPILKELGEHQDFDGFREALVLSHKIENARNADEDELIKLAKERNSIFKDLADQYPEELNIKEKLEEMFSNSEEAIAIHHDFKFFTVLFAEFEGYEEEFLSNQAILDKLKIAAINKKISFKVSMESFEQTLNQLETLDSIITELLDTIIAETIARDEESNRKYQDFLSKLKSKTPIGKYLIVLGFSEDYRPSKIELKVKYRRLAAIYHPDKTTGDEAKFKELSTAYSSLMKHFNYE